MKTLIACGRCFEEVERLFDLERLWPLRGIDSDPEQYFLPMEADYHINSALAKRFAEFCAKRNIDSVFRFVLEEGIVQSCQRLPVDPDVIEESVNEFSHQSVLLLPVNLGGAIFFSIEDFNLIFGNLDFVEGVGGSNMNVLMAAFRKFVEEREPEILRPLLESVLVYYT